MVRTYQVNWLRQAIRRRTVQYRLFGRTGWRVSSIGMGCWALGGQWGPVPESEAIATVHAAIDAGINLFDTADSYGPRRSEELLGKALGKSRRADVFIATKVGNLGRPEGHPLSYTTPEHIYVCCDASLKRLQTDHIDLYQCHIREHPHHEVFLEAFERLLEVGKIRAYGTSSFITDEIELFDRHNRCHVVQLPYSVLDRTYERDVLPLCASHNIGTLIRGPLAQGVLTGKFTRDHVFDDETRADWNSGESRTRFQARVSAAERLRPLITEERTMAQLALAFSIARPGATCAIPGARSPEQAIANAAAGDISLSADELSVMDTLQLPT